MTFQWHVQLREKYIYNWNDESVFILNQIIEEKIWKMKEKKKNDYEYTLENEFNHWENQSIEI